MFHEPYVRDERGDDPEAAERLAAVERLGNELLSGQSDRQKEISGRICDRLKAGADLDDLKPLIADLSRTATEDARRRDSGRQAGGWR